MCLELIRFGRGALVRVHEPGEIALDPLPFGGEKLADSSRFHGLSVTCRPPQRRAAEGHSGRPVVRHSLRTLASHGRGRGFQSLVRSSGRARARRARNAGHGRDLARIVFAVISDIGGRTYHGTRGYFVDGGSTCSRTSASPGRPSDDPGELIGGDSGVRASGRAEPRRLGPVGPRDRVSLVVGAVVAARTSLPPAVAEFVTAFGGGVLLAAIALGLVPAADEAAGPAWTAAGLNLRNARLRGGGCLADA